MSNEPKRKRSNFGRHLRETLGFDLTEYDFHEGHYHVRCSRCQAVVINGVPCHERGCPNQPTED
jgi:hypothetical protein